ncbi:MULTISPECIES: TetR/AcrR family transcriptional regulator [unclassified Streptomyces]|uniref:TetR/AcrR family transcriptional regulator n=1 Tax=unclassified Streptomyces TaxID=2593676 RepID=UPI0022552FB0|nr:MULTISPECIES: TetR/AcrR family transcriptional regulator [unclassified Streptomyces]MCX4992909.1 TetR/AcrR family transcriptional regulator [Streptomyces sp. NBC_00568]MCX5001855.1 TetR/AcrR family transcriptional regulator [Streptomyces sp. NBC_00638]
MPGDRLDEVLDAAYACLTRYGVRRTTMDDIASAMGVSRSAVYQYVHGKDDAFRRLAGRLHERALLRARRAAGAEDAPYAERVRGVLAAKLDLARGLAGDSPHTAELLDEKARLFGDICHAFTGDLRRLLIALFTSADAGARSPAGVEPAEAADICLALVAGLESAPDGGRLLAPAADALLTGLLGTPADAAGEPGGCRPDHAADAGAGTPVRGIVRVLRPDPIDSP